MMEKEKTDIKTMREKQEKRMRAYAEALERAMSGKEKR